MEVSTINGSGRIHIIVWQAKEFMGHDEYSEHKGFPIYTLQILNGRIYVVDDAYLASAVQSRTDRFSFDSFMVIAAERLAGNTPKSWLSYGMISPVEFTSKDWSAAPVIGCISYSTRAQVWS